MRVTQSAVAPLASGNSEMNHVSRFSGRNAQGHARQDVMCHAAMSRDLYALFPVLDGHVDQPAEWYIDSSGQTEYMIGRKLSHRRERRAGGIS